MEISYNNYPMILHTSFDKDNAPDGLPFQISSFDARNYLEKCNGLLEMFGYIAAKNTISGKNSNFNYLLNEKLFHKIDRDDAFRQRLFSTIFSSNTESKNGVILFPDGGQYVYMLLSTQETKKLKNEEGRYIATALFKKDTFIGFEEGYISNKGIKVENTGWYEGGMDVAGYISFVLITLAFVRDKIYPSMDTSLKEQIFEIKYK